MNHHSPTIGRPPSSEHKFIVVRRNPPLPAEPEFVVVEDGVRGDAVAVFWNEFDAQDYAEWRQSQPISPAQT